MANLSREGVSVITCTNRSEYMENIFQNYEGQKWADKELIIVLNKDSLKMDEYKKRATARKDISVYQLSEEKSLAECLNFAVVKTNYNYIAKLDDDDYYAPLYLTEAMNTFKKTNADIVGKRAYCMYLEGKKALLLFGFKNPKKIRNKQCNRVAGPTIMFKKKVFFRVQFTPMDYGSDVRFLNDCLRKRYKIYSSSHYHFVLVRRADPNSHTWKISDKTLFKVKKKLIKYTRDFKPYIVPKSCKK